MTISTRSKMNFCSNALTRRAVLSVFAAGATAVALPLPADALTAAQARAQVERLVDEVNAIIRTKDSDANKIRRFEDLFRRYADTDFMARYALGADGRSASSSELRAFTRAFEGYISRKYGKRFREFIGGRLEVVSAEQRKSIYEVRAVAYLQGEAPFDVTFQLSDRSGNNLFVNMFIEGVNLLLTERAEIGAMLDSRGRSISAVADHLNSL